MIIEMRTCQAKPAIRAEAEVGSAPSAGRKPFRLAAFPRTETRPLNQIPHFPLR